MRGKIIRPLLCLDREEIESILKAQGIDWCTDATNMETDYTGIESDIIFCLMHLKISMQGLWIIFPAWLPLCGMFGPIWTDRFKGPGSLSWSGQRSRLNHGVDGPAMGLGADISALRQMDPVISGAVVPHPGWTYGGGIKGYFKFMWNRCLR